MLGLAFGLAITLGNAIGAGILRTPGEVAGLLPNRAWVLAAWLVGGLYAVLGALSLAELGALVPRSGGQYVFVRRALGEYPAFVVGWSDWISSAGSIAAVALVIGECCAALSASLAGRELAIAFGIVLAFALLQARGIRVGDRAQQATSALKALVFVALVAACWLLPSRELDVPASGGAAGASASAGAAPAFGLYLVLALQAVIFTYDGWNGVLYFGEELEQPGRDIPSAMIGGVLAITAIYLAVNLALLHVLGLERLAGDPFPVGSACRALFGASGERVARGVMVAALLSSVNALLLLTSRVPVALSRDRLLPRAFADVAANGTPLPALAASAAVALAFLWSGTFEAVLAVLAFFFVVSYALSFASVFVLRRREPGAPRPFRVPGYPWTTALSLAGSLAFLAGASISDWSHARFALLLLAASLPIYALVRAARARVAARPPT